MFIWIAESGGKQWTEKHSVEQFKWSAWNSASRNNRSKCPVDWSEWIGNYTKISSIERTWRTIDTTLTRRTYHWGEKERHTCIIGIRSIASRCASCWLWGALFRPPLQSWATLVSKSYATNNWWPNYDGENTKLFYHQRSSISSQSHEPKHQVWGNILKINLLLL